MHMLAVTERCRYSKNIIPTNTLLLRNGSLRAKKAQPCHKVGLCFRNKLEISTEFLSYYFNFSVKLEIKCLLSI